MSIFYNKADDEYNAVNIIIATVVFIVGFIIIGVLVGPKIQVYKQNLQGQANLKQQEWEKQILIEGAKAQKDSASLLAEANVIRAQGLADAEVVRAAGVDEANRIIADGLGGAKGYLQYLYIQTLNDSNTQLIYVPTEAGLPILEANRF